MRCKLDGHLGTQDIDTGLCVFYGISFSDICEAATYFKPIKSGPEFKGVMYGTVKLLKDVELGMWYSGGRWWPDKRSAYMSGKRI